LPRHAVREAAENRSPTLRAAHNPDPAPYLPPTPAGHRGAIPLAPQTQLSESTYRRLPDSYAKINTSDEQGDLDGLIVCRRAAMARSNPLNLQTMDAEIAARKRVPTGSVQRAEPRMSSRDRLLLSMVRTVHQSDRCSRTNYECVDSRSFRDHGAEQDRRSDDEQHRECVDQPIVCFGPVTNSNVRILTRGQSR
jgi:hypothetical protein